MNEINFTPNNSYLISDSLVIYKSPEYVGYYRLGGSQGISICVLKKPNWFHRKMMKLCLGWEWFDGKL